MVESGPLALRLVGGLALLLLNGLFVTTEFAMTRVRQFSAAEFVDGGGLERAWEMTEELEIYLSGCQVGITIASVGLGVVAEPAVSAVVEAALGAVGYADGGGHTTLAVVCSLAVINLAHVIVGEQAPTYLGVERTKTVARYGAPVLYWWTRLMAPFIRFADWTAKALLGAFGVHITRSWTEDDEELSPMDLREEMGRVLGRGHLPNDRREEVLNALEIGDLPVREIVVPREDIVAVSTEDPVRESLRTIRTTPRHTRFPLVGDSLDDPKGLVYEPTVLTNLERLEAGDRTLEDVAVPPMTVDADTSVSDVIDRFQEENQELALVTEDGRVVGLVTASDAFEAITGDLYDPLDLASE